ncbi:MAG: MFS transporter [Methylocystis sp.]|nr:MFS transporter [Methylocystis sp.]MCA3583820.1 MFS transporter [Methylocystis sp.]MCA3586493.1 MFS transporter [Methylocystis sp.]MCA3589906.1 MFS transporter [Methylocystis sp.]
MRLAPTQMKAVVILLGAAQTLSWASTYYLPAVLATPMARDLGLSPVWIFAAFSGALIVSALIGPWAGARIDRLGGRELLVASNLIFALGLGVLAVMQGPVHLCLGWLLMGIGMGIGLYEAAFATLAGLYGEKARSPITGVTLIAGFASTVGWPMSAWMGAEFGWRGACAGWAAAQLLIALPLNAMLPAGVQAKPAVAESENGSGSEPEDKTSPWSMWLLAYVFAAILFCSTALATHLPRLLEAAGATTVVAIAAASLIGPAQVAARIAEFGLLRRVHPLVSARIASLGHPVAAAALLLFGAPAAYAFTILHGAGNGVMTIAKGTLPLALFGPAGYGLRQGVLSAPARILQAFAPVIFGFALEQWGAEAIWLTGIIGFTAFLALLTIRRPAQA